MLTVTFASKDLENAFRDIKKGTKMWGQVVAKKYIERINALQAVNSISEFGDSFRNYDDHPLKGKMKHLRAFTLHDRWRVIYQPTKDGKGATIQEVSNHYGD